MATSCNKLNTYIYKFYTENVRSCINVEVCEIYCRTGFSCDKHCIEDANIRMQSFIAHVLRVHIIHVRHNAIIKYAIHPTAEGGG